MFYPFSSGQEDVVKDGLVLWLDAGDRTSYPGGGNVWRDLTQNANNGTLINGPTFNSLNGGNLIFDGVDDYFLTDLDSIGSANEPFSFGGYFKLTNTLTYPSPSNRFVFSNYVNSPHDGFFAITSFETTPKISLWFRDNSKSYSVITPGVIPTLDTWYNVYGVRDVINNEIRLFVNGQLITSNTFPGNVDVRDSLNSYYGGIMHNSQSNQILSANIGQTIVYNKALSANEISQNFNATRSRFGV
jgi:hypothetical protein